MRYASSSTHGPGHTSLYARSKLRFKPRPPARSCASSPPQGSLFFQVHITCDSGEQIVDGIDEVVEQHPGPDTTGPFPEPGERHAGDSGDDHAAPVDMHIAQCLGIHAVQEAEHGGDDDEAPAELYAR